MLPPSIPLSTAFFWLLAFHDRQQESASITMTIGGLAVVAVQPPGAKSSAEAQLQLRHVASAYLSFSTTKLHLLMTPLQH
jgi:lipid-binding SYLF domain-containing protein